MQGVSEVVMESTAQYWRPVWYGLEPHFRLHLTHPLQTRAPRGRKSDFRDAQRLAGPLECGRSGRELYPRGRAKKLALADRTRVQMKKKVGIIHSHVEGLLEQGGIKLAAVVSDLFGVSGWAMLESIAQGITDVEVLGRAGARVAAQKSGPVEGSSGRPSGSRLSPVAAAAHGPGATAAPARWKNSTRRWPRR